MERGHIESQVKAVFGYCACCVLEMAPKGELEQYLNPEILSHVNAAKLAHS